MFVRASRPLVSVAAAFAVTLAIVSSAAAQPAPAGSAGVTTPNVAGVRFVRSITPGAIQGRPSLLGRIARAIVGRNAEPQMQQPYGVAVGPDRRVYVADTFGRAIHVYDLVKPGYSTIDVDGDSIIGVACAGDALFVTDSASGRVMALNARGRVQWTLGRAQGFERPAGIVAAGDRLYVVDTLRNRVVIVRTTGVVESAFGTRGSGPGQFNFPTNIARAADGRLFVTDTMNFRVQAFDAEGKYLGAFGHLGDGTGDFSKPKGVAIDSAGHIYVVEGFNDVVQIFDQDGRLLFVFGGSGSAPGRLWLPTGIAIVNDMIYVSDSANRRVEMYEYVKGGQ